MEEIIIALACAFGLFVLAVLIVRQRRRNRALKLKPLTPTEEKLARKFLAALREDTLDGFQRQVEVLYEFNYSLRKVEEFLQK